MPPAPACPPKEGYIAKPDTNWQGGSKTTVSHTSAENAQKICNLDANCIAWNSFGYYILKSADVPTADPSASGVVFVDYPGMCTYVAESSTPIGEAQQQAA